jgi:hypothetical protein
MRLLESARGGLQRRVADSRTAHKLAVRSIDRFGVRTGSWAGLLYHAARPTIDFLARLGWFLPNIGVPVLAPIALLALLNFSISYREIAGDVLKMALQHGQLFRTVIAMSAAASYEPGCALGQPMSVSNQAWIWVALIWYAAFILGSSVLVVFGSADARKYCGVPDSPQVPNQTLM